MTFYLLIPAPLPMSTDLSAEISFLSLRSNHANTCFPLTLVQSQTPLPWKSMLFTDMVETVWAAS